MRIFVLILLVLAVGRDAVAQDRPCTKAEAREAESSIIELHSWEKIYKSFKKYRHCDDGSIAEGYSDEIVSMLSSRWNQLGELEEIASSDKSFLPFVLSHVDATTDISQIEKIVINSTTHCPKATDKTCGVIEKTARKALEEIKK